MSELKNVLLVTNSATEEEITQIKNAMNASLQKEMSIKLNLIHVVPPLPTCYFNIPSMATIAERYYSEAKESLNYIGDLLYVPKKDQWLISGKIRNEVLRLATKLNCHFILASSSSIRDLHKSFLFRKEAHNTPIQTINRAHVLTE